MSDSSSGALLSSSVPDLSRALGCGASPSDRSAFDNSGSRSGLALGLGFRGGGGPMGTFILNGILKESEGEEEGFELRAPRKKSSGRCKGRVFLGGWSVQVGGLRPPDYKVGDDTSKIAEFG